MKYLVDLYRKTAFSYIDKNLDWLGLSNLTADEISHIKNLASSVMMTRDKYILGGGFVQAVIDNNLEQAINRADNTAIKGLKAFVIIKNNCYVNETVGA